MHGHTPPLRRPTYRYSWQAEMISIPPSHRPASCLSVRAGTASSLANCLGKTRSAVMRFVGKTCGHLLQAIRLNQESSSSSCCYCCSSSCPYSSQLTERSLEFRPYVFLHMNRSFLASTASESSSSLAHHKPFLSLSLGTHTHAHTHKDGQIQTQIQKKMQVHAQVDVHIHVHSLWQIHMYACPTTSLHLQRRSSSFQGELHIHQGGQEECQDASLSSLSGAT